MAKAAIGSQGDSRVYGGLRAPMAFCSGGTRVLSVDARRQPEFPVADPIQNSVALVPRSICYPSLRRPIVASGFILLSYSLDDGITSSSSKNRERE